MQKKSKYRSSNGRSMMDRWRDVSTLYKIFMAACGALAILSGAAVAWDKLGVRRVVPALTGYVDDTVDERVKPLATAQSKFESFLQSSQTSQMEGQLANLQGEMTKWQAELPKTSNPSTRTLVQNRIGALKDQIDDLTESIRKARGVHGK